MKNIIVSEKIKEYRKENHITQEEFGKLLGVSAQAISKWERKECYPDIASLLHCSVNDLFVWVIIASLVIYMTEQKPSDP